LPDDGVAGPLADALGHATMTPMPLDRSDPELQRAELILAGGTGSGYLTRAPLRSTAENVLCHAPCDVLVVR
jgi:hypothetical protein